MDSIPIGSRWLEIDSNRVVKVLGPGPSSPWLQYDDGDRQVFYCCIEDFQVWNRFKRLV